MKMTEPLGFIIRKGCKEDVPFVTNSWLRSYRSSQQVEGIPNTVYYQQQHLILERIVPQSMLLIACNESNPSQILGYICAQIVKKNIIFHYLYVKGPFRKFGVATKLFDTAMELYYKLIGIADAPFYYVTHRPNLPRELLQKYGFVFNPYLLYAGEHEIFPLDICDPEQGDRYSGYHQPSAGRNPPGPDDQGPVLVKPKL